MFVIITLNKYYYYYKEKKNFETKFRKFGRKF